MDEFRCPTCGARIDVSYTLKEWHRAIMSLNGSELEDTESPVRFLCELNAYCSYTRDHEIPERTRRHIAELVEKGAIPRTKLAMVA